MNASLSEATPIEYGFSSVTYNSTLIHYQEDVLATNYVAFIAFTILIWDHVVTFYDEVQYIWPSHKSPLLILFFINRYFTPLAFVVNLTAYLSSWPPEFCEHFVRYEGSCTIIAVEVTALMMLLRVKAMYASRPIFTYIVALILFAETALNVYLMLNAQRVQYNDPYIHACTMIFKPTISTAASFSAWLPLIYDTVVIALTVYRCIGPVRQKVAQRITHTLLRDGVFYYSVIFTVNLILAIMIVKAPPGIKNITAQLQQIFTVVMMSRITINLKKQADPAKSNYRVDRYFPTRERSTSVAGTVWNITITTESGGRSRYHRSRAPRLTSFVDISDSDEEAALPSIPEVAHHMDTPAMSADEAHELRILKADRIKDVV